MVQLLRGRAGVHAVAFLVICISVLSGLAPFLRRTGVIYADRYLAAWQIQCGIHGTWSAPLGIGKRCVQPGWTGEPSHDEKLVSRPHMSYVMRVEPWEIPAKAAKDVFAAGTILILGVTVMRERRRWRAFHSSWPLLLMAVLLLALAIPALLRGEVVGVLAGLRGFSFVAIALAGTLSLPAVNAGIFASWLPILMSVQVCLLPWEFLWGLPVNGLWSEWCFPKRLAGMFIQANSLGVFAVVALGFVLSFSSSKRLKAVTAGLTLLLALASGSGTALIVLLALAGYLMARAAQASSVRVDFESAVTELPIAKARILFSLVVWVAVTAGTLSYLPTLVGRFDVYDSLKARWSGLGVALSGTPADIFLGRGLGEGTNTLQTLRGVWPAALRTPSSGIDGDSLLQVVVLQTGLVGFGLIAIAFVIAFVRDDAARPFYISAGLSALTLNIAELFPVSLLLGFVLARSLSEAPNGGETVA